MPVGVLRNILLWSLCAGVLLTACNPRLDEPALGVYRATLALPGGETPFGMEIAKEQQRYVLYLINGSERTRVDADVRDRELTAVFPGSGGTLRAQMHRDALSGNLTLIEAGRDPQVIAFRATLGDTWRFDEHPSTDNADVSGRWEMIVTGADSRQTQAIGVFEQRHDRVTGTVATPAGQHIVEGQVRGDDVQLSRFAGGPPFLYRLRVNARGDLQGEYWEGLAVHGKVAAYSASVRTTAAQQ